MTKVPLLFLEQLVVDRQAHMIRSGIRDPLEILEADGVVQMVPIIDLRLGKPM
jgi:hypothetical protein